MPGLTASPNPLIGDVSPVQTHRFNFTGSEFYDAGERVWGDPYTFFDVSFDILEDGVRGSYVTQCTGEGVITREFQISAAASFSVILAGNGYPLGISPTIGRWRFVNYEGNLYTFKNSVLLKTTPVDMGKRGAVVSGANTRFGARLVESTGAVTEGLSGRVANFTCNRPFPDIIVLGSTIMTGAFGTESNWKPVLRGMGVYANLRTYAAEGSTLADTLTILNDTVIPAESSNLGHIVAFIHAGGEDVTNTLPYDTATDEELAEIKETFSTLLETAIKNLRSRIIVSPLTYRTYPGMGAERNGSLPYNENIFIPALKSLAPTSVRRFDDTPYVDLYSWAKSNQALLDVDGVSYTAQGNSDLAAYVLRKIVDAIAPKTRKLTVNLLDSGRFVAK